MAHPVYLESYGQIFKYFVCLISRVTQNTVSLNYKEKSDVCRYSYEMFVMFSDFNKIWNILSHVISFRKLHFWFLKKYDIIRTTH